MEGFITASILLNTNCQTETKGYLSANCGNETSEDQGKKLFTHLDAHLQSLQPQLFLALPVEDGSVSLTSQCT